ncbi:hypothetical protein Moror_9494 [Moniliophthora roreri MCA 2997]|uniref:F-box domain-containing protein n=1 Tax=Moniliophthora roreri (strain MCA 2997) TaxID=1381753 RepID=V2Y2U0_MONRO|nr:hypothetical protein Moror_9494 [Moniliophthora roreri MCA 2997]
MEKALDIESPVQLCDKYYFEFPSNHERSLGIALLKDYVKGKPANHVPFDHEIPALAPLVWQAEDELAAYDDAMTILQRKHADLWVLKEQARGMIRPSIRTLPPELLLRIFTMCRSVRDFLQPTCHTTLTLSHVCVRWRAITFSESILWSNIRIQFRIRDNKAIARQIRSFTKLCLSAFTSIPLATTMVIATKMTIVKHSSRWRDVTLNLQEGDTIDLPDALPFLESLSVRKAERADVEDAPSLVGSPIFTPRLVRLHSNGIEAPFLTRLDTRSLVRLSTTVRDSMVILNVLRDSPALQVVSLLRPVDNFGVDDALTPRDVVYSPLHTLEMYYNTQSRMLQRLSLPSLTSLEVSAWSSNTSHDPSAFIAFLQQSRPPLSKLTIRDLVFTSEDFARILRLLPSISTLCIRAVTAQLSENLTIPPGNPPYKDILLPNLTTLSIHALKPFDDKAALAMVRSRLSRAERAGAKRLGHFFLRCYEHHLDKDVYNALDRLDIYGELDVEIDLWDETASEASGSDSDSDSEDSDDSGEN